MNELYVGLMSGTSIDGIDAVLVNFGNTTPELLATHYQAFSEDMKNYIFSLCQPGENEIERLSQLDVLLGKQFAEIVKTILKNFNLSPSHIRAIGSHGQTIRHYPDKSYTLQIGDPNIIAAETGITTIADFRRRDVALGGQGAPLVPAFHAAVFRDSFVDRAVVNIGGIANVTLLPADNKNLIFGFDTGPGNLLLNAWSEKHLKEPYDHNGKWASRGTVDQNLLRRLLDDNFFKLSPPKSTGREYFNLNWLEKQLLPLIQPQDVQATLVELTTHSIINSINKYFKKGEIYVCGGGANNIYLMQQLKLAGNDFTIYSTEKLGIHPDWVEATAFAWLAKQTLSGNPGNIPNVTGAKQASILGAIFPA